MPGNGTTEQQRLALLGTRNTPLAPPEFLGRAGHVFTCFDQQDSGNVSFGIATSRGRYFVKTAGAPDAKGLPVRHADRVALLANAERLARSVEHPALTRFVQSCDSSWGPMLIYQWVDGEHLHERRENRDNPSTAWQRFLHLPLTERLAAAQVLLDLHVALASKGWVTGDFYDGCLIYDFARQRIHVFDLDNYRMGAYQNEMGRMFGSTRFMAPEEFELGRTIDERTTVFAMGRTLSIFLSGDFSAIAAVVAKACAADPAKRHRTVAELAAHFAATIDA